MIVVDTNVLSYLLIQGDRSEAMDRLLKEEEDWAAPRLWLDEFLNVLFTYERNELLSADEITPILNDALALMQGSSYEVPPERILAVARRTGCSAYDSQYIALAEDLGTKLYTCDRRILAKCEGLAVEPK
ncbi:MAG: type II toxin-antitoxin system VapC family toxin [Verrucomicrobiota bacterium]